MGMAISAVGGPSVGRAIRGAAVDFYYNSWRLVPANILWAVGFLGLVVAGPTLLGLVIAPLLALPTAGLFAMAGRLARLEPTAFGDFGAAIVASWRPALLVGAATTGLGLVFTTNLLVGLRADEPLGWFVGAAAFWGIVGLGLGLLALWPLLGDPRRRALPLGRRLRLAALVLLVRPLRIVALGSFSILVLVVSTVLVAALLTVSVAYLCLVAARVVLPIADLVEPPPAGPGEDAVDEEPRGEVARRSVDGIARGGGEEQDGLPRGKPR